MIENVDHWKKKNPRDTDKDTTDRQSLLTLLFHVRPPLDPLIELNDRGESKKALFGHTNWISRLINCRKWKKKLKKIAQVLTVQAPSGEGCIIQDRVG